MQLSGIWLLFTYLANYTEIGKLLPISPFQRFIAGWDGWEAIDGFMKYVNWFVPVGTMIQILTYWGLAIGVFYAVMAVLRWVKIVGD